MSKTISEKMSDVGNSVTDVAKSDGGKIAQGAEKAVEFVRETGVVDGVEVGSIKLTRKDSPDDQHHFIPLNWISHVDSHVHLNRNSKEAAAMMKTRYRRFAAIAMTLCSVFFAPLTSHAAWELLASNTIKLVDGPGSGPGGQSGLQTNQLISGGVNGSVSDPYVTRFQTFCVQRNEGISLNTIYSLQGITTNVVGAGAAPLNAKVGALYKAFIVQFNPNNPTPTTVNGAQQIFTNLGSTDTTTYNYGGTAADNAAQVLDADAMQNAVWHLQGQITLTGVALTGNKFINAINAISIAQNWLGIVNSADFATNSQLNTFWGGTKVLNIGTDGQIQDQLFWSPVTASAATDVPEPATMFLFGLGAIGAGWGFRRRRI